MVPFRFHTTDLCHDDLVEVWGDHDPWINRLMQEMQAQISKQLYCQLQSHPSIWSNHGRRVI